MDIKQIWREGEGRYAYILTVIDVFTRVVLYCTVGYQMRQEQIQNAWEKIIKGYFEPLDLRAWEVDFEVRSDNGPQ
ncbi:MAG: transposase family protein, partial [Saprospiraceae bacterium]|nr:transposase family protein [Saprospiraceae bacterium]